MYNFKELDILPTHHNTILPQHYIGMKSLLFQCVNLDNVCITLYAYKLLFAMVTMNG